MEYVAAEPENNEKNRLCIDYSGTFDGKWMTDAYGCQPMSMLAMADYTKTGVLTVAYTDSMKKAQVKNTCPYAGVLCYDTIHQTCNIGEHLVGVRGNCMYPETAYHNPNEWSRYDLDINGNIQEAWQYDCKTLDSIESTNYTQYQHYETSSGGAILDIYCAENSVSSILFPLAMTAGSMQPDAALG